MSQNARVARWVPTVDPDSVGESVVTDASPNPNNVIRTKFALGGSGGGVAFATDAEMQTGTETLKAVSPATYRTELVRLFDIPDDAFVDPIAVTSSLGIMDANLLIKTDSGGRLNETLLPAIIDGGTF